MLSTPEIVSTWLLAGCAVGGMVARPWSLPEWLWPAGAALGLILGGLLPARDAVEAVAGGWDVYLFIGGMMVVAELARREGVFDWLAAFAVNASRGSSGRLFAIVYGVGALVTVFMSNDATAVVLTPAVAVAAKRARVNPLPCLFACAMVANAASFALPISNPANLVVFGGGLPGLSDWVGRFALSSLAATLATYAALRLAFARDLKEAVVGVAAPTLSPAGRAAAGSAALAAVALLVASAARVPLGLAAAGAGLAGLAAVCAIKRQGPFPALGEVSWSTLILVAGLFVVVRGLERAGLAAWLAAHSSGMKGGLADAWAGIATALAANVANNLPAGMLAASALTAAAAPPEVRAAVAVGIDLGPNLTLFGSLSSVLWMLAARREGVEVGGFAFAKVGLIATPAALLLALALLR